LALASLIADVGATNARFALLGTKGDVERVQVFSCANYASIKDAITAYLGEALHFTTLGGERLQVAAFAVAGPVTRDQVALTNHPWAFSISELRCWLAVDRLVVVNDFMAVAAAVPHLKANDRIAIGGGRGMAGAPIGVIGPGSGLGVSGLLPAGGAWFALSGEGGHVTMATATARESLVLERMRSCFGHVSAERVLSGPGIVNLYTMLAEIDGVPAVSYSPTQITDPEIGGQDHGVARPSRCFVKC